MSRKSTQNRKQSGVVGADRWKAPDVLQGGKSTFASDIYSFGMCILEVVSGKFPWGTLPDIAVRYHILEKKQIPVRPENCSEAEYSLVGRMCRFDPSKRIGLNAVVDELKTFRNTH
ncbi:Serine/threonine-protein kinase HT1 [Phytophthora citrophthora]|uniref:Serine/threonine-protein kinase HT1 n=1 Tax=Phytophthora citrophthora TaxID=4793 RepID=A0AAD9GTU0_9STRA|nr:Serine/threonine-protein kinase HT1 [Phytophthora citrophthora]